MTTETTERIERTIEAMRKADTEFITPETVAQFAAVTQGEAALVLYERKCKEFAELQHRYDLLSIKASLLSIEANKATREPLT